jgi:ABC-2 type transport system ATP-binding protein
MNERAAINIDMLCKSFCGIKAVNGLSMTVQQGELFGLIGPDGAGKTTTIRILCGLQDADGGQCRILDREVATAIKEIHTFIGYMPQRFSLYPDLTVAENLQFFADLYNVSKADRQKRTQRLLEFSCLQSFAKRKAEALSGGMKQKLALSCMLIHTPKVLLLDEPTFGVDPVSRREFWAILKELQNEGVTILVTTPYMDEAAKCDRVGFMHHGELLLLKEPGRIPADFKGVLIELYCQNTVKAARRLAGQNHIDSVQIFGDKIHISGKNEEMVKIRIETVLRQQEIQIEEMKAIPAGLDDVFVQLINKDRN